MANPSRADFRRMAESRIRQARLMFQAGELDAAYYLGGYAVECGLKACVLGRLMTRDEWPERNFSDKCYKHEFSVLLTLADLDDAFDAEEPLIGGSWGKVSVWKETSRYDPPRPQAVVAAFLDAIDDPSNGVLTWIKTFW